jgi:hypothetical protein
MQSVYYTGHIGGGRRKRSNLYTMEEFVDNIINDFPDIAEECQYRDDFNNCLIETSGAEKRRSSHRRQAGHIQQRRIEHYRPRNYSFDGKRKSSKKSKRKSKRKSSKKKSKKRKY